MSRIDADAATEEQVHRKQMSNAGSGTLVLAAAEPGRTYHVTCLGDSRQAHLELLSAGLSPDGVIELLRGDGPRPRIVACGEIRAAIGAELAAGITLRPCGCGCGCDPFAEES